MGKSSDVKKIPGMKLKFKDRVYSLSPYDLVFPIADEKGGYTGLFLMGGWEQSIWLISENLMRHHYVAFNYDNKSVGISTAYSGGRMEFSRACRRFNAISIIGMINRNQLYYILTFDW